MTSGFHPDGRPYGGFYANRIEITRRDHDAIVTFWLDLDDEQKPMQVAGVVVPLSVLDVMEVHA